MTCFILLLPLSVQLSTITQVNLPGRSEYSAISKAELAYISAYLLTGFNLYLGKAKGNGEIVWSMDNLDTCS